MVASAGWLACLTSIRKLHRLLLRRTRRGSVTCSASGPASCSEGTRTRSSRAKNHATLSWCATVLTEVSINVSCLDNIGRAGVHKFMIPVALDISRGVQVRMRHNDAPTERYSTGSVFLSRRAIGTSLRRRAPSPAGPWARRRRAEAWRSVASTQASRTSRSRHVLQSLSGSAAHLCTLAERAQRLCRDRTTTPRWWNELKSSSGYTRRRSGASRAGPTAVGAGRVRRHRVAEPATTAARTRSCTFP